MRGTCGCSSPDAAPAHDQASGGDRVIALERDLLANNDSVAVRNRERLAKTDTVGVNLISGPGAGKTMLLVATLKELRAELACAVVEGDQGGELDAARVRATGVPAAQLNTGKACHLDDQMIAGALDRGIAPMGVCSSSKTSATWYARPASISARTPAWSRPQSPTATTSRSNILTSSPLRSW